MDTTAEPVYTHRLIPSRRGLVFLRVRCEDCGEDRVVAFSCQRRSLWFSGRRRGNSDSSRVGGQLTQLSTVRSGTRANALLFSVASVQPRASACAAISSGPPRCQRRAGYQRGGRRIQPAPSGSALAPLSPGISNLNESFAGRDQFQSGLESSTQDSSESAVGCVAKRQPDDLGRRSVFVDKIDEVGVLGDRCPPLRDQGDPATPRLD